MPLEGLKVGRVEVRSSAVSDRVSEWASGMSKDVLQLGTVHKVGDPSILCSIYRTGRSL